MQSATAHSGPRRLLSGHEVAELLGLPESSGWKWVNRAANRGLIPSHKVGHYRRFQLADVEAYLNRTRDAGAAKAKGGQSARSAARNDKRRAA